MLRITLKDMNGKLCEFKAEFLKKEVHNCYQKLLEELRGKQFLDDQGHERKDLKNLGKCLKPRTKKEILMNSC